jgi:hypothetical protein
MTRLHASQPSQFEFPRTKSTGSPETKSQQKTNSPESWTKEMGQDGEAVASKIQAMQRGKQARREVQQKREQKELGRDDL